MLLRLAVRVACAAPLLAALATLGPPSGAVAQTPAPIPLAPAPAVPAPLTIAAVGDVMIGSAFPDDTNLPPNDGRDLMSAFTAALHAADIAFGNLEGPLLDDGVSTKCPLPPPPPPPGSNAPPPKLNCFAFRMPTRYVADLAAAGFTVMSVANNHAGDFGEAGRASTRRTLRVAGIRFIGSDRGAFATAVLTVRGMRVGFAGFAHNDVQPSVNDIATARALVTDLKSRSDIVVVSFHGGGEGVTRQHVLSAGTVETFFDEPRGDLRTFTHTVIDAGADLVLGHGPHVLRGMETYRDRLIVYSMGNFCTYGMFALHDETALVALFQITLDTDGRFLSGKILPGRQIKPGGPFVDPAGQAIRVLQKLSAQDFGAAAPAIDDDGTFIPSAITVAVPLSRP